MRRPLFALCLCLVSLAALGTIRGGPEKGRGAGAFSSVTEGELLRVTGYVYQKEAQKIYLKDVSVQDSVANLQQKFSANQKYKTDLKLVCQWKDISKDDSRNIPLGCRVLVEGSFRHFSRASNPGEFDMAQYGRILGIEGRLTDASLLARAVCSAEGPGHLFCRGCSPVQEGLQRLKEYWKQRLYCILPEKEASVMSTMLLGDKADLDQDIKRLYKNNGIVHILSISGIHITIIGMSVYKLLRRMGLPVWAAAFAGGLLLCLYGVMTGLGVSACRAIGMYLLRMLGELWGRTYDMLTALGLVGAAAVLANPLYLRHAGFLLSYGAVLGIGVLQPVLFRKTPKAGGNRREKESFFLWVKGLFKKLWGWAVQTAAASISVTLITLPVLLWFYYEVPVYAVLLNLFVLPLMKPILFFGMLGMLVPFLQRAGEICTLLLKLCEDCCLIFEKLPFHTWNPGKPMLWQVVCYYLLLAAAGFFSVSSNKCKKGRSLSAKGMCLAGAVLVLSLQALPEEKITFLDVGQGDSICIQTAAGDCCVFDCGSSSRSGVGKYVLIPFLKQEGISHVDAVFLSHPDKDHCSGIEELLLDGQGITVGELVLPDVQEEKKQEEFESLLSAVQKGEEATGRKIRVSYISAGTFFQSGELSFTCLHPPKGFTAEDANGYSECFYVKKQGTGMSLLLTGDVEEEGEELLIKELKQRGIQGASLLKAGHHGSENATGQELLELIKPELTIISCGKNNRYGHPREEVLERLEKIGCIVLKTPDTGAVTVKYQRGHILAEPYLKPDA